MTNYRYFSMETVYEAERKALEQAACEGASMDYMRGIVDMVGQIESDLLDKEQE